MHERSMLKKMIAKISVFVIFASTAALSSGGCAFVSQRNEPAAAISNYEAPKINGQIKSADITESSGIAASRCQSNIFWTHNDSGDDAFVFAINGTGDLLGTWKVAEAENIDWEDIATYKDRAGKCYIYIGEIGDNKTRRADHSIYRIPEPLVTAASAESSRSAPLTSANAETVRFAYPDFNQDAETLMIHPKTGEIYVVTKRVSGPAGVYRIKPDFAGLEVQKAELVAEVSVPAVPNGFLTGGDISPDGRRVIICDYTQAYEFSLPASDADFGNIWKQQPETIDMGKRRGGESVCYSVYGTSIFATSEGKNPPIIEVRRRSM